MDPGSAEAVVGLATLAQSKGDLDTALAFANRVIELEPDDFSGYSIAGRCCLAKREPGRAVEYLLLAVSLEPNLAILFHLLAQALQLIDRDEEAVDAYRRAIQLAPHIADSHMALGQLYIKEGNRNEAVSCFRRAYKLEPKSARGLTQLAKALVEEGDFMEAEKSLRKAIQLDGKAPIPQALLGQVLVQLGRFEEAAMVLQKAIAIQPSAVRPYLQFVQCRKIGVDDQPILDRMVSMLDDSKLIPDERRHLLYALGKAYDDLGQYEVAIRYFDEANRIMFSLVRPRFDRETHATQFDLAIQNVTSEFLEDNLGVGLTSDAPIFIVGMIRSGTTLVEQIVSSHPDIEAGGELRFWLDHTKDTLDPSENRVDPSRIQAVAGQYLELVQSIASEKSRVTDKMPLNYMFLGVMHLAFPNARIIHCRRSPIDNCLSIYLTPFPQAVTFAHSRENIVFYYEEYLRLMEHWRSILPADRFLEVDYEDLITNREAVTRRMMDFVGLGWSDSCLHPEANRRAVITPSTWQVRQPVYRTSIDRWRHYEQWLGAVGKFKP